MNIGIVCYPTFGGSGVVATELGIEMAKLNHEVHFITYRPPARLSNIFSPNIFYHEVPTYNYPLFDFIPFESTFVSTLVNVVINHHIDILHVHYAIPFAAIGYMLKEILRKKNIALPIITTLHGTDITLLSRDKNFAPIVEFSINQSTAITTVSHFLKKETRKIFHIEKEIQVIYNFIDTARFKGPPNEKLRQIFAPNKEKIITHISNFRKVKRVEDVVSMFVKFSQKIPAKLLMIGDGPERAQIEEKCRNCIQCKNITLLGKQEKIEDLLLISDLLVLPSEMESFGLSALEAMSAGVPLITTNIGGLPELNEEGKTGYLFPIGDTDAMASKAVQLFENPTLLNAFKHNAKRKAETFSKEHIIPHYLTLYERLIR